MDKTRTDFTGRVANSATGSGAHTFADGLLVAQRYRVERFVAAGGMGEVYQAHDVVLDKRVALKVLPPARASERGIERFRREISLAQNVTHPSVCRIHDLGFHGSIAFLTMQFLDGETLADRIARGPLSPEVALPLLEQMAEALDAAHDVGVVHRDFKSRNVILTGGDALRAVVTDFGLAVSDGSRREEEQGPAPTDTGEAGTSDYMAPEQRSRAQLTSAVDVYALGVVMHEMLTGRVPAGGLDPRLLAHHARTIQRCLDGRPEARFGRASQAVAALRDRPLRRRGAWRVTLLALIVIAAAAAIWATRASRGTPLARSEQRGAVVGRMAVGGFRNLSGRADAEWLAGALAQMLTAELAGAGRLPIVSSEELADARNALGRAPTDEASQRALASLAGARYTTSGSYTVEGETIRLSVEIHDEATGDRLFSATLLGSEAQLGNLAARARERIFERLSVGQRLAGDCCMPRVAAVSDPLTARQYFEGLERLRLGEWQRASELLAQAGERAPREALIQLALANAYGEMGRSSDAEAALARAVAAGGALPGEERRYLDGRLAVERGELAKAKEIFAELFREHANNMEYGNNVWGYQTKLGDLAGAAATIQAVRLNTSLRGATALQLMEIQQAQIEGKHDLALALAERLIEKAENAGAHELVADTRIRSAVARLALGDLAGARVDAADARASYTAAGGYEFKKNVLATLSVDLALQAADFDEAQRLAEAQREHSHATGNRGLETIVLIMGARVQRGRGDLVAAARSLERARPLREVLAAQGSSASVDCGWYRETAELALARARFTETMEAAQALDSAAAGEPRVAVDAARLLALARLGLGDRAAALTEIARARTLADKAGEFTHTAEVDVAEARILASSGSAQDIAEAHRRIEAVRERATNKGYVLLARHAAAALGATPTATARNSATSPAPATR